MANTGKKPHQALAAFNPPAFPHSLLELCTEQIMLMVQAFPADFDPFKLKLYNCKRERMSGHYES
jgi:hypothetical protein